MKPGFPESEGFRNNGRIDAPISLVAVWCSLVDKKFLKSVFGRGEDLELQK